MGWEETISSLGNGRRLGWVGRSLGVFSQNTISSLGNGRRLGFWKDPWCNETVLCNEFPTLFNLAVHKDARVVEVWDSSREEGGWSPVFQRPFNDWEMGEVERFLHFLANKKVRPL